MLDVSHACNSNIETDSLVRNHGAGELVEWVSLLDWGGGEV